MLITKFDKNIKIRDLYSSLFVLFICFNGKNQ